MGGKSEERKISEGKIAAERKILEKQLAQQLGQLRGIQAGQEEALGRAQDIYGGARGRFGQLQERELSELSGTPQEITQLQQLIRERALPEQQQALRQTKLAQTQAGVRGPEAALQAAMASSRMGTDLARSTQEVALKQALQDRGLRQQEALRRQQAAEAFEQQQAMAGLGQTLAPVQKFVGESALETQQKKKIEELEKQNTLQKQLAAVRQFQKQQIGVLI
jgi:hypothetical protein